MRAYIFFCLSIFLFKCIKSNNKNGDICKIRNTNEEGTCRLLQDCPAAVHTLTVEKKYPQICGYDHVNPVICCVGGTTQNITKIVDKRLAADDPVGYKALRISEQKCREYVNVKLSAETPATIVTKCDIHARPLIGGVFSDPAYYPHMALLGFEGPRNVKEWLCSGSLISEDFVLTAAHCLASRELGLVKYIRLGDSRTIHNPQDNSNIQDFTVIQSFKHPQFKAPFVYNDIALLKMDRKASLNPHVRPICLQTSFNLTTERVDVTNWKTTDFLQTKPSIDLVQYAARYISEQECNSFYKNVATRKLRNGITYKTQICVKSFEDVKDICLETGGGPLQILNKEVECTYKLVGIASFGTSCFANSNTVEVYTRVSDYVDWIEDIVWP